MSTTIATIDFGAFVNGCTENRKKIALEVDEALRTKGSFYLRNHGIGHDITNAVFDWSTSFFSLSDYEKNKLSARPPLLNDGYFGFKNENVRGQRSLKESFDFGDPNNSSSKLWGAACGCQDLQTFYRACHELTTHLLDCLSIALELDEKTSLSQNHKGSLFGISLLHYPAVPIDRLRSAPVIRNPAHSDLGTLTLLFQRGVGGLQVADMSSTQETSSAAVEKTATFLDVEPGTDTIFVNAGYLLMRWSNGRWKNAVHRVAEPSHLTAGQLPERYSIACFGFPDADTNIEPLTACCSEEHPRRWKTINAGEYLHKKRQDLYS